MTGIPSREFAFLRAGELFKTMSKEDLSMLRGYYLLYKIGIYDPSNINPITLQDKIFKVFHIQLIETNTDKLTISNRFIHPKKMAFYYYNYRTNLAIFHYKSEVYINSSRQYVPYSVPQELFKITIPPKYKTEENAIPTILVHGAGQFKTYHYIPIKLVLAYIDFQLQYNPNCVQTGIKCPIKNCKQFIMNYIVHSHNPKGYTKYLE
jgi:hypothetical protein